jgi:hypothetical protein
MSGLILYMNKSHSQDTSRTRKVVKEMSIVETYNKTQQDSQKNMQRIVDMNEKKLRCREYPKN